MSDSPDENPLGRAVASRRAALGLKRKDLAQRARLSYPYISEIENGAKEPSAKALRQIAEGLDLSVAELAALAESVGQVPGGDAPEPGVAPTSPAHTTVARMDFGASGPFARSRAPGDPARLAALMEGPSAPDRDEELRHIVRDELEQWAATHLPELIRSEVDRAIARTDERGAL